MRFRCHNAMRINGQWAIIPPTVRIWISVNGDWVKITLHENKPFVYHKFFRHDEGWASEEQVYLFDGEFVYREIYTDGRDCDGRLTTEMKDYAHVTKIRKVPCYLGQAKDGSNIYSDTMLRPDWEEPKSFQRDYSAEAMGY